MKQSAPMKAISTNQNVLICNAFTDESSSIESGVGKFFTHVSETFAFSKLGRSMGNYNGTRFLFMHGNKLFTRSWKFQVLQLESYNCGHTTVVIQL